MSMSHSMNEHSNGKEEAEAREILYLSGGAALMILGAGLVMTHPALRRSAKAALAALMPEIEQPFKAGIRGVLPDVERYLRLKSM